MPAQFICIQPRCETARHARRHRQAGLCGNCSSLLAEIDTRRLFPWRAVIWSAMGAMAFILLAAAFPYWSSKVAHARQGAALERRLAMLTQNREADERIRDALQSDLLRSLRLAETILGREARLRAAERALQSIPPDASASRRLYEDTIAKLEQVITADLGGYRTGLTNVFAQRTAVDQDATARGRVANREVNSAVKILDDFEARSDFALPMAGKLALEILRGHVNSLSTPVPSASVLRDAFRSASLKLYHSASTPNAEAGQN